MNPVSDNFPSTVDAGAASLGNHECLPLKSAAFKSDDHGRGKQPKRRSKWHDRALFNAGATAVALHIAILAGAASYYCIRVEPSGLAMVAVPVCVLAIASTISFARQALRCADIYLKYNI